MVTIFIPSVVWGKSNGLHLGLRSLGLFYFLKKGLKSNIQKKGQKGMETFTQLQTWLKGKRAVLPLLPYIAPLTLLKRDFKRFWVWRPQAGQLRYDILYNGSGYNAQCR